MLFLKQNDLRLIGAQVRDSCGSSGIGETPQAFTTRRLTARPAESEHLERKSTTPLYLVNSNKVCQNSFSRKGLRAGYVKEPMNLGCNSTLLSTSKENAQS
ncbi:hypothetical protein FOA20_22655 [Peribacillus simplex]